MSHPGSAWPTLDFPECQSTIETLHQWIQIVGKIRLRTMPWRNHSWHTTLYISKCGFSTHGIPYQGGLFELEFDFIDHKLHISSTFTETVSIGLYARTVADFYKELFEKLEDLGIAVTIHGSPNEIDPAIPFHKNTVNSTYTPELAHNLWQVMLKVNSVFHQFRTEFIGKVSPVHLFWGAFDLAVTRFSGRPAPLHPGGMPNMPLDVMQEAYSHEVSSAGFWPGSKDFPTPIFYSYAYPSAADFGQQKVLPDAAFFSEDLGEFVLKYEDVINTPSPEKTLHDFLETTYLAAVNTSAWDEQLIRK